MGEHVASRPGSADAPPPGPVFRPSIVTGIGSWFVVFDDLQPRALLVPTDEDVDVPTRLLSWNDLPRPAELRWPWRTVISGDDAAHVVDGPGSAGVALRADATEGVVLAESARVVGDGTGARVDRTRFSRSRDVAGIGGAVWSVVTTVSGVKLDASVTWRPAAGPARTWALGRGGVVGCAANGELLAVTVRRADKRPWQFRPTGELALLHPDRPDPHWIPLPSGAQLRGTGWVPAPVDGAAVASAVRAAHGAADVVARHGGGDVEVSEGVEHVGLLALPVVTTVFSHPARPGVRCARRDEPVSELGLATHGLAGMTVILDEDLMFGFLPELPDCPGGTLSV